MIVRIGVITMARKTIPVNDVRKKVNDYLAQKASTKGQQTVLCIFLETILFETENYKGFGYNVDYLEEGESTPNEQNEYRRVYF